MYHFVNRSGITNNFDQYLVYRFATQGHLNIIKSNKINVEIYKQ